MHMCNIYFINYEKCVMITIIAATIHIHNIIILIRIRDLNYFYLDVFCVELRESEVFVSGEKFQN